ncbi:ABC transporter ATP-binding protein [Paenibacillus camelliae]|uniref:ABC transporter ATP-binding protein n=1 Tax=Paenibacillus camelliae TaxID=512410 RepID=UPI00203A3B22|nr:ABC transporter ATP-binding protein [Paenibacillus camelliae]MCM3634755.1 ABC transporter ATP-binding protein [Paenibacillus camelliae]
MSLLKVEALTKKFGSKVSVDALSFALQPNTATALIGPNGAGKTTTMSMICGLLEPSNGKVTLADGGDIRKHIGFLPQYPKFYSWLSALEYVEMTARLSGISAREAKKRSEEVLTYVGLGKDMKRLTSTFSGGMKQRLGIAQAIVHKPQLLLLDEPVSALDPIGRAEVMELLKELQRETTILYSTHILHDAEKVTDQVLFMKEGRLVEEGTLQEIQQRYANPRYSIEFVHEAEAEAFAQSLAEHAVREGSNVTLPIDEQLPTMNALMALLSSSRYEIIKVERESASLDQIFMKVAGVGEFTASTAR